MNAPPYVLASNSTSLDWRKENCTTILTPPSLFPTGRFLKSQTLANDSKMKLLTLNFLTCARKTCKANAAAFPLHPKDAELEQIEIDMNAVFVRNMLPRLDWEAMKTLTQEVSCRNSLSISYNLVCAKVADWLALVCSLACRICLRKLLRRRN